MDRIEMEDIGMPGQISFDLKRKTMMVTGAGRGIGKVIALACARGGADLALGSRHVEECERVDAACRELGVRARAWSLDVVQLPSIRGFVESALAEFGRIDVLVNNAGITIVKPGRGALRRSSTWCATSTSRHRISLPRWLQKA